MGLQNRLQDCYVSGDRALARRYVSSLTLALALMAVIAVAMLSAITPLVDWATVFPTKTVRPAGETAWAVWTSGVIVLLGVAVSIPYAVYAAFQELHVANLWEAAAKVLTLAACIAVVYTRLGLVGVIVAASGTALLVRGVNAVWFFGWEKPWLAPSPSQFDRGLLGRVLSEGVALFVLQVATALIFHVDKLIIGNRLGAGAVAGYAVVGRLFLPAHALMAILQTSLWPAYGEALRRGDVAWARRAIGMMVLFGTLGMAAAGAVLYVWRGPIVAFATRGQPVDVPPSLIVAVTAFFVVRILAECQSVPLNAAGIIRPQVWVLLANGVLNVLLALLLVGRYGVVGVAWAFPITSAVTSVWAYPLLIRHFLRAPRVGANR